jgi:hypothetical protein
MTVGVQPLLPDATTKIVSLTFKHLAKCFPELRVADPSLAGSYRKTLGFEQPE